MFSLLCVLSQTIYCCRCGFSCVSVGCRRRSRRTDGNHQTLSLTISRHSVVACVGMSLFLCYKRKFIVSLKYIIYIYNKVYILGKGC